jgi:hypothetical protein
MKSFKSSSMMKMGERTLIGSITSSLYPKVTMIRELPVESTRDSGTAKIGKASAILYSLTDPPTKGRQRTGFSMGRVA